MEAQNVAAEPEHGHRRLLTIDSELSQVKMAAEAVREISNSLKFQRVDSGQIELALVESVNNCIEHSYSYQAGNVIDIDYRITDSELEVSVIDDGPPAQALGSSLTTEPDIVVPGEGVSVDSLPVSGWGVMLIKSLCDNVTYNRDNDRNILSLTFTLSKQN